MSTWEFEHSVFTHANRMTAWHYWSDIRNHARMEPAVIRNELDGPFATGTIGRTITHDHTQEWELTEVLDGERFIMTGYTPDGAGALSFAWTFSDEGAGTRLTQRISAYGPEVDNYIGLFRQMEAHAPEAMARLAADLDRIARETASSPG
jgi:hypothetical protein